MTFDRSNPNESSYKGKLVLRSLAFFLVTIAVIPAAYSWRISLFLLPVIGMSWLWNLINIIKRLRSEYPVHPGANVACDLIIWLLFFILGGLTLSLSIFANLLTSSTWRNNALFAKQWGNMENCTMKTTPDPDDEDETTTTQVCSVPADQIDFVRRLAKASIAACAFAAAVWLIHFILFIWACVDTHRYRRDRRDTIAAFKAKQNEFSTEHYEQ